MSDIKYCPSCGTTLSLSAVFCHKCGQKQKVSDAEPMVSKEDITSATEEKAQPQEEKGQAIEQVPSPQPAQTQSNDQEPAINQTLDRAQAPDQTHVQVQTLIHNQAPEQVRYEAPKVQNPMPEVRNAPTCLDPVSQSLNAKKAPGKKKFPWFFAVLWTILFIAVGGWGFYLYYLYSNGGDFPQFTEDAQRIVLFTVSIALLIYTLSLKLTMKKLKAFPTVILILALLVIFYLFTMVELTDGDWLHDTVSEITDSILPASGD